MLGLGSFLVLLFGCIYLLTCGFGCASRRPHYLFMSTLIYGSFIAFLFCAEKVPISIIEEGGGSIGKNEVRFFLAHYVCIIGAHKNLFFYQCLLLDKKRVKEVDRLWYLRIFFGIFLICSAALSVCLLFTQHISKVITLQGSSERVEKFGNNSKHLSNTAPYQRRFM